MDDQQKVIDWAAQVITLVATTNTIFIAFNLYHLDDPQLQAINAAVSAVGAIIGNIYTHRKTLK